MINAIVWRKEIRLTMSEERKKETKKGVTLMDGFPFSEQAVATTTSSARIKKELREKKSPSLTTC